MRLASRRSWVPANPPPSLPPGWPLSIDTVLLSTGSGVASLFHNCCCVVLATTCLPWATVFSPDSRGKEPLMGVPSAEACS